VVERRVVCGEEGTVGELVVARDSDVPKRTGAKVDVVSVLIAVGLLTA